MGVVVVRSMVIRTGNGEHVINEYSDLPTALAAPARRALAAAEIRGLEDLTSLTEDEVRSLHGMGPKAMTTLRDALRARSLSFAER
jgi:hypothetical protein